MLEGSGGRTHQDGSREGRLEDGYKAYFPTPNADPESDDECPEQKQVESQVQLSQQYASVLAAWALLATHSLIFDETLPVLALSRQDTGEGLGFTTGQIGLLIMSSAIFVILVQILIFPYLVGRSGELTCFRTCAYVFPFIYLAMPSLLLINQQPPWRTIALVTLTLLKNVCSMFAFPCAMVVLSNSAISIEHLSWLNSAAMIAKGTSRTVGSATIGILYSWGTRIGFILIPWVGLAGISVFAALPTHWLHNKESQMDTCLLPDASCGSDEGLGSN
jgi:hypothetical protein